MSFEDNNTGKNFFEQYDLKLAAGEVEIGETYPIYGMITNFLCEEPGSVIVEINFSIKANMAVPDGTKVELLKERAFEPGIFVSKVLSKEEGITVDCSTVVFGKKQKLAS